MVDYFLELRPLVGAETFGFLRGRSRRLQVAISDTARLSACWAKSSDSSSWTLGAAPWAPASPQMGSVWRRVVGMSREHPLLDTPAQEWRWFLLLRSLGCSELRQKKYFRWHSGLGAQLLPLIHFFHHLHHCQVPWLGKGHFPRV